EWCEELAGRRFLRAHGVDTVADGRATGRYRFAHALYQQVLYERLSAARRVRLHRRIGDWEETAYSAPASDRAAELAIHFERGRDHERAVRYLSQAADNALRRQAPHEAVELLTRSLKQVKAFPDPTDRAQHELAILVALGVPLLMTKGYAAP